jgi:hypothetical protein
MITKNLENDKNGFYLINSFDLKEDEINNLNLHITEIKNINEILFKKCGIYIYNDISEPTIKSFFLFYNGILIGYKNCQFEIKDNYILCHPILTCSFTKILKQYESETAQSLSLNEIKSVIIMLEKIKESFKDKHFYFPIYVFQSRESCKAFLENNFKIVLLDIYGKVITPSPSTDIEKILKQSENLNDHLKEIIKEKIKEKKLDDYLLPHSSPFFSENPFLSEDPLFFSFETFKSFLIYSPKELDEIKTDGIRKSKKKMRTLRKSKSKKKMTLRKSKSKKKKKISIIIKF